MSDDAMTYSTDTTTVPGTTCYWYRTYVTTVHVATSWFLVYTFEVPVLVPGTSTVLGPWALGVPLVCIP